MNLLILGGFLGSGKTTVLLQLAKYITGDHVKPGETKVAIIENEIGEQGIDDKILKSGNYSVENLFAGCACCTLSGSVPVYVSKIQKELNPEWLIFESTGVGYPASIQRTIKEVLDVDSRICIIVDAKRWLRIEKPMEQLLSGQFENADIVLINKKDLVDQEVLEKVTRSVAARVPDVKLIPISAVEPVSENVWEEVLGRG